MHTPSRRQFLKTTAIATTMATPFLSRCVKEREANLPNFIILFADDMGYGDIGPFGHPTIQTPNLNQMAREGMKFTQFYMGAAVCTPSRAALLTGRLPVRSGMGGTERPVLFPDSAKGLPEDEITIASALKQKNYATGCFGKWHLGHLPPYLPTSHGFDTYFGIPYSNDMSPAQNDWKACDPWPPTPLMLQQEIIEQEPDQSQLTRRYTEHALTFMEENKTGPFFVYLPYTFPHIPLYASDAFKGKSKRGLYGDAVEEIDWSVGKILDFLDKNNLQEKTLVIFTSDNGPWLSKQLEGGSAGLLREGKGTTWEGGIREPMIAWQPETIPAGTVNSSIATSMDLFPTLLKMAGIPMPTDRQYDGTDISPLFRQEQLPDHDTVFYYWLDQIYAIRKGSFKAHFITTDNPYTRNQSTQKHNPPLLYNLNEDPSEQFNVADAHPEIIAEINRVVTEHNKTLNPKPSQLEAILPEYEKLKK